MTYNPPVKTLHYLLRHAVDMEEVLASPAHEDTGHELIGDVLSGAASFASEVLAPINGTGDTNPAKLTDEGVVASPGFKEAYRSWIEGGWQGLSLDPSIGGMGLPQCVHVAVGEMFNGSNMAFGLCPMLTSSAISAIDAHANDELKSLYLQNMVTGQWSGAMNLTEPQAGSDLGAMRAKASANPDGSFNISGQKIFITWGDHDLAENIIHLVLARLPDAPAGSKGISLFLCPKYHVESDGSLGARNSVKAISLEHKLGIHGSPTCVMEFENAQGWLVGEPNQGLACMFTMMNEARLFVGVQGVGIGERAFQAALAFSQDRVQGRVINAKPGTPIAGHPDVRRMLFDMKVKIMAARAICLAISAAGDLANCAASEEDRKRHHAREALLTPIGKSYGSDIGVEVASTGIQIHGGMGFVEETGVAQHYRDARIAPIYEGTNGIQALDLTGRKIRRDGGEAMYSLIRDMEAICELAEYEGAPEGLNGCVSALKNGIGALNEATSIVLNSDDVSVQTFSTPFLNLAAHVVAGALLTKAATNGMLKTDDDAPSMLRIAEYHATSIMPQAVSLLMAIKNGVGPIFGLNEQQLADL